MNINKHFNKRIDILKSYLNKYHGRTTSNKMRRLYKQKKRMINAYINKLVHTINTEYAHKEIFIVGYNEYWKQGANLGKSTNRKFNEIPYRRILNKLREILEKQGKILIEINESYTSKCDALALEEIKKHAYYSGKRKGRLFQSNQNGPANKRKLIHSDLNGAINIMRKLYTDIAQIKGKNIFNPKKIKIKMFSFNISKQIRNKEPMAATKTIKRSKGKKIKKQNKKETKKEIPV